jgi:hypothetical protein
VRAIRDERGRLEAKLTETIDELQAGHANARLVLDYLDDPYGLYERAGISGRMMLNRTLFTRLWINVGTDYAPVVADDELTEPFATIVYLRRTYDPKPMYEQREGGIREPDTAFHSRVLVLLKPIFAGDFDAQGSSNGTLAEDAGFEPARGCPQHDFQSCALGH